MKLMQKNKSKTILQVLHYLPSRNHILVRRIYRTEEYSMQKHYKKRDMTSLKRWTIVDNGHCPVSLY